jgi:hypothetical protein
MPNDDVRYARMPSRFFREMTDEEFHVLLHGQDGCLTLDQYGKMVRMKAEDRAKGIKEE